MSNDKGLYCNNDFITISSTDQSITMDGPNEIKAQGNVTIHPPIVVKTFNTLYVHSNDSVSITNNVTTNETFEIHSNIDCIQDAVISIGADAIVTANRINIRGHGINILGDLVIANGSLLFEENCDSSRSKKLYFFG